MTPHGSPHAQQTVTADVVVAALRDRRVSSGRRRFVFANAVVTGPVALRYLTVRSEVVFRDCVFRDAVSFRYASFARQLRFLGCRFEGGLSLRAAHLPEVKFAATARSGQTVIQQYLHLDDCDITGTLTCDGTRFEGPVSLIGAHIGASAWFEKTIFLDELDLRYARIDGQLLCDSAQFGVNDDEADVTLEGAAIGDAYFDSAVFRGELDCGRMMIAGELSFEKTRFEKDVDFNGLVVGGRAFFTRARFGGAADFGVVRVTRQLSCQRCRFAGRTVFNGAEVGDTFFTKSRFRGPADFTRVTVNGQLVCDDVRFLRDADLTGIRAADLFLDGARCRGDVNLSHCAISGDLVIAGARFGGRVDLSDTQIGNSLAVFTAPGEASPLEATQLPDDADLRALSYKRTDLEIDSKREQWLALCGRGVTFEPQPFLVLEQVLRSGGRDQLANAVHYEMRVSEARHLRERVRSGLRGHRIDLPAVTGLMWNRFLQGSVGYGVYGYRLMLWVLGILLVASILADVGHRHGFITTTKDWKNERFIPYLYALDSFLPVIGLSQRKYWTPSGGVASHVAGMLLVLGWITVPLLVGLVSGALKKKDTR